MSANYFVKDEDCYVIRPNQKDVSLQNSQPASLPRPKALRLLADWLETGNDGRLVRAVSTGPSRAQLVAALKNTIGAYERANVFRVDQETDGPGSVKRLNDDARVEEARKLIARVWP
jgi:hypothetical protein